jgi:hypothetical protein
MLATMRGVAGIAVVACALAAASSVARADGPSDDELAKKNTGSYLTGLPLINYSPDTGVGYGARIYYYYDGDRDDPRFKTTPYLYRVFLQGFTSTRGLQFHWLDFDAPKIFDSPFRVRSQLIYERNINQNYFGDGNASLAPLHFPGSAGTFKSFSAYTAAEQQVTAGTTFGKYDQYDLLRPIYIASLERLFLNDRVRVLGGVGFSYARIRDYTGQQVDATDATGAGTTATEAPTRLKTDCDAGTLVGCNGGWDNFLRFGISYDTRDYEPDPNRGVFIDAAVDAGTVALGSQYDYVRAMIAARGFWSPAPDAVDLVLADRFVFEGQTSGTPFFSMDTFPFTEDPRTGLGGQRTMRGFRQDRFVGPIMVLDNVEARWTFAHACFWRQKFAFIIVPFLDVGRPYSRMSDLTLRDLRASYGGSLRIAWNLATLITIDYGFSDEDTGFYVNFNHMF